jgi:hypothetical protein
MRRPLALAALFAFLALPGATAYAEDCHNTVNVCPTATSCSGYVSVCPMADPDDCSSYVDVCLDFIGPQAVAAR